MVVYWGGCLVQVPEGVFSRRVHGYSWAWNGVDFIWSAAGVDGSGNSGGVGVVTELMTVPAGDM